ncbi:HTH-type transcriptional regulator CynR [Zhongshania aliphaticivorans]|uniref:HTH-type transcriptional regulator CynR n=1 Tax=Zhongshania aliphaticivorans TaxID=1470434 RepID=A0A5S9QCQ9_9GAMM|nr:LysR family transcriptional regulator [Zhongshania aliphaticivorans]CAA0087858.1 HTH-type transcriptional regulator CynR [Zhongshania aliphaticivorans]CAA0115559.1 HTH-type transcriptional regulator CynR [Zhongshania aliphaticivorans]CAA0120256.1 HTH-type transcriptional regulator CynR [Zhongshania aliphaticivorans]
MDTESLKAFLAVAELHSFSLAAEQLFITQPAVSKRIATLESQLNCKLFDRIGRNVHLTEAGHALLPQSRRILQDIKEAVRSIHDLRGHVSGRLSMGISHHIGLHRLPPILRKYSQLYPDVKLDIDFMDSEQAHQLILHGEMDLAVITLAPTSEQQLQSIPIWEDPLKVAVAHNHALAHNQSVTTEMLSQYTALPPGLNTYTGQIIKDLFDQRGLKMTIGMSTNYLETIKVMVSIGLGWSILPLTLLDDSVTALEWEEQTLSRTLGCVHHRNRSLSNAAEAFIELLKDAREDKFR